MGLAFDVIQPIVQPAALGLFNERMERYHVAGEIFYKFGLRYNIPENKINTAMMDLRSSVSTQGSAEMTRER